MGSTSVSGMAPPIDREEFLRKALADDFRRCGGRPGTGRVTFQTTSAEIVAIDGVSISADSTPLLEACLSESVWSLVLPLQFDEEWNVWSVSV